MPAVHGIWTSALENDDIMGIDCYADRCNLHHVGSVLRHSSVAPQAIPQRQVDCASRYACLALLRRYGCRRWQQSPRSRLRQQHYHMTQTMKRHKLGACWASSSRRHQLSSRLSPLQSHSICRRSHLCLGPKGFRQGDRRRGAPPTRWRHTSPLNTRPAGASR